jgi:hypothetical protein
MQLCYLCSENKQNCSSLIQANGYAVLILKNEARMATLGGNESVNHHQPSLMVDEMRASTIESSQLTIRY